jgi:hypothetical protein
LFSTAFDSSFSFPDRCPSCFLPVDRPLAVVPGIIESISADTVVPTDVDEVCIVLLPPVTVTTSETPPTVLALVGAGPLPLPFPTPLPEPEPLP